jgi:hypothetical protein
MVTKVKAFGSVIVILCHPPGSTLEGNISAGHEVIEPIYHEPNNWDKCLLTPKIPSVFLTNFCSF